MNLVNKEISRFLVAGISAVGTDAGSYFMLLEWLEEPVAKGLSFVLGSIVAFVINKFWTFESKPLIFKEVINFILLYMGTLIANVSMNHIVLMIFPSYLPLAFLVATGTSTILNFIGMKFWVFNKNEKESHAK